MTIYQVFTRLFGNDNPECIPNGTKAENGCGTMADFTDKALQQVRSLGATHIWYTGIIEHATQTDHTPWGIQKDHPEVVKGRAGSPYAIKDYYDVDPDLATDVTKRMKEFDSLVRRTHQAGLGVIIDFVPNHVAREYHSDASPKGTENLGEKDDTSLSFSPQNNFYYLPADQLHLDNITTSQTDYREQPAKVTGNDCFSAWPGRNDWYETVKLNYGIDYQGGRQCHFTPRPSTWDKMLAILLFWAAKGVDAFRCDMAEMVPVEFWHWAIAEVKNLYPHITFIAEVYNPALYRDYVHRGEFDYLYDKVGLYDTLRAVTRHEASAQALTACWQSIDDIRPHMLRFLENHDEQRLASDFFAADARRGRAPMLVAALMDPSPVMIYFGQELGEKGMDQEGFSGLDGRTTIFDYWSVDTIRRWRDNGAFTGKQLTGDEIRLRDFYARVLSLRETMPVLRTGMFYDLMYANPHLTQQYVFMRSLQKEAILVIANFSEQTQEISVNLPSEMFSFLQLDSQTNLRVQDLLNDETTQIDFTPDTPLHTLVRGYCGVVLLLR